MESTEIRRKFLNFFEKKKHKIFISDKLIPSGDPTLLFTSAGMVQFKAYFLSEVEPTSRRAASCQRCLRTTDIDLVGKTSRHHTFFEMLGNFSFGDYFKEEAILWAWEFLTEDLKLPEESLWVSIFKEDEESADIWQKKIKLPEEKVVRLGEKDNFWAMGETGPCGPCSEIIFDRGKDQGCGKPECQVGCDCNRFIEIWNLVFTQYDRQKDGSFKPLPRKNIDTGMGLERLAAILQGKETNFETDLIKPIIEEVEEIADFSYGKDHLKDISFRIIADHIRAVTFLNSDGVYFSNIGRGYIARRLLRRAARHGKLLNIKEPFLYRLVGVIAGIYDSVYPEIKQFREDLSLQILEEEKRFNETLNVGLNALDNIVKQAKTKNEKLINGKDIFKLYDSFGFPLEMTEEILKEEGLEIDKNGFEVCMENHKEIARSSWKKGEKDFLSKISAANLSPTEFVGYEELKTLATIKALFCKEKECDRVKTGEEVAVILDKTPFYAEAGGQISDTGVIEGDGFLIEIDSVKKNSQGQILHWGIVKEGEVKVKEEVKAEVNVKSRREITHSHTATHLLQAALRILIDKNIRQAGSWVGPDQFRFDFNYFKKLTPEEIVKIENWVNDRIDVDLPVKACWKDKDAAIESGAIALFGEKYGEKVRVLSISDDSSEFCGGTHVKKTGEIKVFKITNEASVASGVRRIEAIMGDKALENLREESRILREVAKVLKTSVQEVPKEVERLIETIKNLEKRQNKEIEGSTDLKSLLQEVKSINGIKVLRKSFDELDRNLMLSLIDKLRLKLDSGIVIFLSRHPDKIELVVSVSPDLVKEGYKANRIAQEMSQKLGGSGGGRPDLGQGGGQDLSRIEEALAIVEKIISK